MSDRTIDSSADHLDEHSFWFDEENLPWRPSRPRRALFGSARLANRGDLAGLLEPGPLHSQLPYYALLLEKTADGGQLDPRMWGALHLPENLRTRHLLAVGQTGCGKTTRLIYPLLAGDLTQQRTVIVFDAKGKKVMPLVEHLAAIHRPGQKVHLLNFRDPGRSMRWNPLANIKTEGDAHDVAFRLCTLVDRGGEREGAFWLNNSIDLLSGILLALAQDGKEHASLGRARQVALMPMAEFKVFADAHKKVPVLKRVCELHHDAHQTGACVFQDLRMRLSSFMDERVCATTDAGGNQIDLDSILLGGGILVIEVNETDVAKLKQVINLFMNHLFGRLVHLAADAPRGKLPYPCSLFLDEFASAVGKIDDMEIRLNTVRERGVSIVAAVQSLSQLAIYGTACNQVLAGFSSKVYFAGLEWSDAEYASRQAGLTTVLAPSDEEDWAPSRGGTPVSRPLLLPEEVARPVKHATFGPPATLFLADTPPMQIYLRPAYDLPLTARIMDQDEPVALPDPGAQARHRIRTMKRKLGFDEGGESARQWWTRFEATRRETEVIDVLARLEPLHALWTRWREPRSPFLDELCDAVKHSGVRHLEGHLAYFEYRLHRRHEEEQMGREPG